MRREEEIEEIVEMIDEMLRNEKIEIDEKEELEKLAKAVYDAESESSDLNALDVGQLTEKLCDLNWGYGKTPIEEADVDDKLREEIEAETDYLPFYQYDDGLNFADAKTKAELKEMLIDAIEEEIAERENDFDDTRVYELLADVFGSETLAEIDATREDNYTTISVEKISDVNKTYLTIDSHLETKAIAL